MKFYLNNCTIGYQKHVRFIKWLLFHRDRFFSARQLTPPHKEVIFIFLWIYASNWHEPHNLVLWQDVVLRNTKILNSPWLFLCCHGRDLLSACYSLRFFVYHFKISKCNSGLLKDSVVINLLFFFENIIYLVKMKLWYWVYYSVTKGISLPLNRLPRVWQNDDILLFLMDFSKRKMFSKISKTRQYSERWLL